MDSRYGGGRECLKSLPEGSPFLVVHQVSAAGVVVQFVAIEHRLNLLGKICVPYPTDQIRKSSRSVCSHIAEAWGRRPYRADFINKLNMAESEALETQSWLESVLECGYTEKDVAAELFKLYDRVIGALVTMQNHPDQWIIQRG